MSTYNSEYKLLQICIQKTASTSISDCFNMKRLCNDSGQEIPNHLTLEQLKEFFGDDVWSDLLSFAFVRNPWDRLVSWYSMFQNNPNHSGALFQYVRKNAPTFSDIVKCTETIPVASGGLISQRNLFQNQIDYLKDENGEIAVTYVGRFETLLESLKELLSLGGMPEDFLSRLPHHKHASSHRHYTEYYDYDLSARVGELYARDIEEFGYKFGE